MADAKQQDKSKEKKEPNSEGVGFKTVMGGFDKNEVNLYINKLRKQMKEERAELETRISNLQTNLADANREAARAVNEKKTAEQAAANASAPIIKDSSAETKKLIADLKAESDKKIMELRKSVLDERRNVAKFDKECAMAKMSEKKVREEFEKLKAKYLELKKNGGGSAGKAVTTSNADEVMSEASAYAKEIINAAKSYAAETVKACDKYKADVQSELKEKADKLNDVKSRLDAQIKKTNDEQASSAARVKEVTEKIGALTALFDSFSAQFNSVNSQITTVTSNIDGICRQFNETTGQIDTVAKQISETTSRIDSVSKQINSTTEQITGFAQSINETTEKINLASRQMNETTGLITEASKAMTETSGQISEASRQMNETTSLISEASKAMTDTSGQITAATQKMNGFNDTLNGAKSEIDGITKFVSDTQGQIDGAKGKIGEAQAAADAQASAADLSPIGRISEEIALAVGDIKAKLNLPVFDEKKFSLDKFEELKKKIKVETTFENSGAVEEDDEFGDSDIISSMSIDSPETDIPSDDDLMSDMPDVITAPVFDDSKPETKAAPKKAPAKADKADRPGLDSDFEDFFLTEPKDDDMSGDIPLINMDGVGMVDDFSLDAAPEPIGGDFDITPIDETKGIDKGKDLGEDIFDIAINPNSADDDTLANMMADAKASEKAANIDLTPTDLNFDEEKTLPSHAAADDFGEFADLFAAGSTQTSQAGDKKNEKPTFKKPSADDPWNFGGDSNGSDSDLSADSDLSDLLI